MIYILMLFVCFICFVMLMFSKLKREYKYLIFKASTAPRKEAIIKLVVSDTKQLSPVKNGLIYVCIILILLTITFTL